MRLSSTILVLTRGSSRKQVKQVITNIQSPLHGYHYRETIVITYASEFQNLLMILYPHDEAKRNSCRLWRDWSPASFCEHLNLVFPDLKNATEQKNFVQCISGMEFAYNLYDVTVELNFSVILQEICDALSDSTLATEEEAVRYLNSKLRDDIVLNLKALFVSVSRTINNGTRIIRTVLDWEYCWVLTLKHMRNMGTRAEACGYGLRETDNTKCFSPSIKPSCKTKSQPVEERAVEKHPCYGCGMLGHKKVTCRFDKSKYFNLANTSHSGSTAHQLLVAKLGPRNSGNYSKGWRDTEDSVCERYQLERTKYEFVRSSATSSSLGSSADKYGLFVKAVLWKYPEQKRKR